jgi:hypothetical protein
MSPVLRDPRRELDLMVTARGAHLPLLAPPAARQAQAAVTQQERTPPILFMIIQTLHLPLTHPLSPHHPVIINPTGVPPALEMCPLPLHLLFRTALDRILMARLPAQLVPMSISQEHPTPEHLEGRIVALLGPQDQILALGKTGKARAH